MVEADGSGLFVVFFLTLYTIVLVPYTIYKLCNISNESKQVLRPWVQGRQKESWLSKAYRELVKPSHLALFGMWLFFFFLVYYSQVMAKDSQPFDPYKILELDVGASDKEVKRAYRQLSLRYHPDKNPDPAAAKYFAEFVTKAYKALSDPVARKNYEEHGHPDGPQSISMGIALPEWLLDGNSKSAPALLAGLVFVFILLPLVAAACYLLRSDKYVGQDGIIAETFEYFLRSPMGLREGQGLGRIAETLTIAVEFINMPTLHDQVVALDELRKEIVRAHPDLRDKRTFWQRKASCVKANMLLLAHLERMPVPAKLQKDLRYVLDRSPPLLAEMVKLASLPRPPSGYGWLSPAIGAVEFQQHLIQAVPLAARRNPGSAKGVVEGPALLLQLPHLDAEGVRKLARKRIRGLTDLQALPVGERRELLDWAGFTDAQVDDIETSLSSIPHITVSVSCEVAGEPEAQILDNDIVTCKASILLSRPSHATQELGKDGRAVAVFAPHFPHPREEKWFLFVADPMTNEMCSPVEHVSLLEAEYLGAQAAQASSQSDNSPTAASGGLNGELAPQAEDELAVAGETPQGQVVEVKFIPRSAAKKEYTLFVMCDSWIGSDRVVPLRIKVGERSRAEREGRAARSGGRVVPLDEYGNPEEEVDDYVDEDEGDSEQDKDYDGEEYDSDESGTEESGSEEEEVAAKGKAVVEEADSDSDQSTEDNELGVVPKGATLQLQ